MTTRRRFSTVWAAPDSKMPMSIRLLRPSILSWKSGTMSSTEIPYSWSKARAIRWRTCSLGVSLTGSPVM
jgi:hypothetical protein